MKGFILFAVFLPQPQWQPFPKVLGNLVGGGQCFWKSDQMPCRAVEGLLSMPSTRPDDVLSAQALHYT